MRRRHCRRQLSPRSSIIARRNRSGPIAIHRRRPTVTPSPPTKAQLPAPSPLARPPNLQPSALSCNAVTTRTDSLVRRVVLRRRAFRGLKTSFEKIGRNVHARFFSISSDEVLSPASQKMLIRTSDEEIGRVVRRSDVSDF